METPHRAPNPTEKPARTNSTGDHPTEPRTFRTILDGQDYKNLALLSHITEAMTKDGSMPAVRQTREKPQPRAGEAPSWNEVRDIIDREMARKGNRPLSPRLVERLLLGFPDWERSTIRHNSSDYTLLKRETGAPSPEMLARSGPSEDRVAGWKGEDFNMLVSEVRPMDLRLMLDIEAGLMELEEARVDAAIAGKIVSA